MKSARNHLILLGLICQGLTWDDYTVVLGNFILWVVCLTLLRGKLRVGVGMECVIMMGGAVGALLLGRATNHDTHYFLGHGLTFMQAVRLTRSLDRREKVFSIVMACFQLGVGCTFLFDLRFIPIFIGIAFLLPASLSELEEESFPTAGLDAGSRYSSRRLGALIFLFAVFFFLFFPRGFFGGQMRSAPSGDTASLLDALVDPTRSGAAQSRRVLLQIQGEKLGYLRCYSLTDYDGIRWTSSPFHFTWAVEPVSKQNLTNGLYRRVSVKKVSFLGRILPTDGRVMDITGRFFRHPMNNEQGAIQCDEMRNTVNSVYEYWIDSHPKPEELSLQARHRLTMPPHASDRLRVWLDNVVVGEVDPEKIARRLESYLQKNFEYLLGGPSLNRLDPLDDFIFNQKRGHCERFASTLALLLRLEKIPSRVVIGYLPHRRGGVDGWYSVRFKDAHAWTEAYIDGIGWMALDATPAATLPEPSITFQDLWETLDMAWNIHVVNFDGASQRYLLSGSVRVAIRMISWTAQNPIIPGALIGLLVLVVAWRGLWAREKNGATSVSPQRRAEIMAGHYYGRMLRALAKQGFHRRENHTPLEFLEELALSSPAWLGDAQLITRTFCDTRYGHRLIDPKLQAEIETALTRIVASRKQSAPLSRRSWAKAAKPD